MDSPAAAAAQIRHPRNPHQPEPLLGAVRPDRLRPHRDFTKPGADSWHGDSGSEDNDSPFNSRNPFVTTQPPYHSTRFDGDLKGPLIEESLRLHSGIYGARTPSTTPSSTPSSSIPRSIPSPFTQIFPNTTSEGDFSTRVSTAGGKVHTLTARYHLDRAHQSNAGIGQFALASQGIQQQQRRAIPPVHRLAGLEPDLLNETRFQYIRDRDRQTPQNFAPTIAVQGAFTGGGSNPASTATAQDHYEFQDLLRRLARGTHDMSSAYRLRGPRLQLPPPAISTASTPSLRSPRIRSPCRASPTASAPPRSAPPAAAPASLHKPTARPPSSSPASMPGPVRRRQLEGQSRTSPSAMASASKPKPTSATTPTSARLGICHGSIPGAKDKPPRCLRTGAGIFY